MIVMVLHDLRNNGQLGFKLRNTLLKRFNLFLVRQSSFLQ